MEESEARRNQQERIASWSAEAHDSSLLNSEDIAAEIDSDADRENEQAWTLQMHWRFQVNLHKRMHLSSYSSYLAQGIKN